MLFVPQTESLVLGTTRVCGFGSRGCWESGLTNISGLGVNLQPQKFPHLAAKTLGETMNPELCNNQPCLNDGSLHFNFGVKNSV